MDADEILVFDTGPLSHFSMNNWLGPLKAVVGERRAVIPDVDDRAARKAAESLKVKFCPTLALLCESIRQGLLTPALVGALADDLLSTEYHLPFSSGGFVAWATENGLVS